jgi:hypothetical protein
LLTPVRDVTTVLRWSAGFFRHHAVIVLGISLGPAVERFVSVLWLTDAPGIVRVGLELATTAIRLILLLVVYLLAVARGPAPARSCGVAVVLVAHGVALAAAFVMFDIVPGAVMAALVAPDRLALAEASLLAAKNLTVIAFTMVWVVGMARQLSAPADVERTR